MAATSKKKTIPKGCLYQPEKIDVSRALKLYAGGATQAEIARIFGVTRQAVCLALKPFKINNPAMVKAYQENKADILDAKELEALNALTPDKLEKASARDVATVFGILTDKQRLAAGKSTANINVFSRMIVEAEESLLNNE